MNATAQQMSFRTTDLIKKLEENHAKHVIAYNEAMVGYREQIEKTLRTALKKFKADNSIYNKSFIVNLATPMSYAKEYTTVIEMLKFCTDDTITLDRKNFENFVLDEWNWTTSFISSTSVYNGKTGK